MQRMLVSFFYVKCTPSLLSWSRPLWLGLSPIMQMCRPSGKSKRGTSAGKIKMEAEGGGHIKIDWIEARGRAGIIRCL